MSRGELDDRFAPGHVGRRHGPAPVPGPDSPVQLMLGVFDFPAKAEPAASGPPPVPELVVSRVRGHPLG